MSAQREPYQVIRDLAAGYAAQTDAELLDELARIPPLADEDDPCWNDDAYWDSVAYPYLALWEIAARRRLRATIPLILDRACYGDPGEIMRGLCHALEAIVRPEFSALTEPCIAALASRRAGTRMWAAFELVRLRDPAALPALEQATRDEVPDVRNCAAKAIEFTRRELKSC